MSDGLRVVIFGIGARETCTKSTFEEDIVEVSKTEYRWYK